MVDLVTNPQNVKTETLQRVAAETGYNLSTLWKVYGYESSYGTDPDMNTGEHQGPFQFSADLANALGIDRYDLYESAKAYVTELQTRRKSMENNILTTTGDFSLIDSLDPALVDYLLHQQGGKGVARLALAHYSGEKYTGHKEGQQGYMNKIQKTLTGNMDLTAKEKEEFKGKTAKDKVEYFINYTKERLGER